MWTTSCAGGWRSVAALLVLVSVASCGGCSLLDDDTDTVVTRFAEALGSGRSADAAALTDNATNALAVLTEVRTDTGEVNPSVRVEREPAGDTHEFTLAYDWDFGQGRTWSYQAAGTVDTRGEQARVRWAPAVVHPELGDGQSLVLEAVPAKPSAVIGATGEPLLTQQELTTVAVAASDTDDQAATATGVAALLSRFDASITPKSVRAQLEESGDGSAAVVKLRPQDVDLVRAALAEVPGVRMTSENALLTVDRALSSPAFAQLDDAWQQAQDSVDGWRVITTDTEGAVVRELVDVEPGTAQDVVTTISRPMQLAAERAVAVRKEQTVLVAVQPSTGGILTVAQNAAADADGPLALSGLYPPGSTFKMITTTAALAAGAVEPDTVLPCPGTENIQGRQIKNDNSFDLGSVPLHTAFAQSCNTTLARLAVDLPPNALHDAALSLGLGIDWNTPALTTVTGSVPVASTPAQRVEASIGQGEVLATPIGMALATASVVRGKVVAPSLLTGRPGTTSDDRPAQQPGVHEKLLTMMRETVTSGSARALRDLDDVGGKTGTAQYGDGVNSHGWFVAVRGDLVVAVLVVGGQTSGPAVQTAGTFLRAVPAG